MSGRASVRLRLRRSDSLALRQIPPLPPLPVLPQLPLESSSAVVDAETQGNVGDGRRPPGPRPEDEEVDGASPTTSFEEVFSINMPSAHRTPHFTFAQRLCPGCGVVLLASGKVPSLPTPSMTSLFFFSFRQHFVTNSFHLRRLRSPSVRTAPAETSLPYRS